MCDCYPKVFTYKRNLSKYRIQIDKIFKKALSGEFSRENIAEFINKFFIITLLKSHMFTMTIISLLGCNSFITIMANMC